LEPGSAAAEFSVQADVVIKDDGRLEKLGMPRLTRLNLTSLNLANRPFRPERHRQQNKRHWNDSKAGV
jgi:hypothetical protein